MLRGLYGMLEIKPRSAAYKQINALSAVISQQPQFSHLSNKRLVFYHEAPFWPNVLVCSYLLLCKELLFIFGFILGL